MTIMTRRACVAAFVLPVLIVSSSGCDIALGHFKEKATAEWRKSYELQPGGRLEISNVNGKIDVEPATGNTVDVVAEKSAHAGSVEAAKQAVDRIEIQDTASAASIRIETKMPMGGNTFGGNQQVHYTVRVPAGAEVKFSTINGGIELTGLNGRIVAETTNGGVKAHDVSGSIDASTTNGGVEVELSKVPDNGVKLECTNGGIVLRLPSDAKATISARITNGGIDTSGVQIESTGENNKRRLDGRMNGGGPRIDIEGTNGGIRISGR
jgi:hypothetical protein